jgi:hypothetical protein
MKRLKTNKTIEKIANEGTTDVSHIVKLANEDTAEWTDNDSLNKLWQHDQSILNTPYIGDPPPGTIPQVGDAPGNWKWPTPSEYPSKVGWICPKCGRCLAPHVDSCPYCSNETTTINITY